MSPKTKQSAIPETKSVTVLVGLPEAAEQLGMTLAGIKTWVIRRQIDFVKVGRLIKVKQTTIDEIIERGTVKALDKKRPMAVVARARQAKAS